MATRVANTKHFRISKLLGEQIRLMSPGELLPTVAELIRKYKSSQATITQALDRLRTQGLVERPSGKKRLVVTQISARSKFKVTLVRPLWSSPDYDSITNRIYELGNKKHFGFNIHIYSDIRKLNIEHALKESDAGLIIGNLNMSPEQIAGFNGSRKPIVFLRDKPSTVKASSLWVNDIEVGQMATQHLLELGHKKIAVMLSEPPNPSSSSRLQGWKMALQSKGIKEIDPMIIDCSVEAGKEAMSGSYDKFSKWLDAHPRNFTAIFCVGWTGALAALRSLRERSVKVPGHVSVITYASESPLCDFTVPPLTTIEMDLEMYTRQAIRLIQENLNAEKSPPHRVENILLSPHLVIRESTAKPRSSRR